MRVEDRGRRLRRRLCVGWVGLAVLGVSPVAWAVQTVAVLPFSDLAGGKSRVGEAIRETVTSDLREISVLKVLERDRIDKVVVEQDLRAKVTTLDAVSMVRVGTLLGASLIVTGAYQRAGATVRLTARVVKVQTGEILGTAKVDGPVGELLSLQDRITGQLLSSAGIERTTVARKRPRVKSWRTYELYGDAVVEPDDTKRRKLLQLAVAEDPGFAYAVRDLDALEQRMAGYSRASARALKAEEETELDRILVGKVIPSERVRRGRALLDELSAQRRLYTLVAVAPRLAGVAPELDEHALYRLFEARVRLHKEDLALKAGERYLKAFPTGSRFRDVEKVMGELAEARRKREARVAEYEADLKEKRDDCQEAGRMKPGRQRDWDYAPCIAARWDGQTNERMLKSCRAFLGKWESAAAPDARDNVLAARFFVVLALDAAGEFAEARPLAEALARDSGEWRQELQKLMSEWPTD